MSKLIFVLTLLVTSCVLVACVSTASITSFPKTNSSIDFDEISKRDMNADSAIWTFKGRSEYFVAVKDEGEKALLILLTDAMKNRGYSVSYSSPEGGALIGERGLRMNEWGSVAGIYFRKMSGQYWIYVRVDITQDITGGINKNLAAGITYEICRSSRQCEPVRQ